MAKPIRIQRKRTAGWRMPLNSVSVTRPGLYGNPYLIGEKFPTVLSSYKWYGDGTITLENCIPAFEAYAESRILKEPTWLEPLRNKNLACFCAIWQCALGNRFGDEIKPSRVVKYCPKGGGVLKRVPCHADTLLEFANR